MNDQSIPPPRDSQRAGIDEARSVSIRVEADRKEHVQAISDARHVADRRWLITIAIWVAAVGSILAAWLMSGCASCPCATPTTPDTTVVEVVTDPPNPSVPADPGCPAACARLVDLQCAGWWPQDGVCADGCALAVEAMGSAVDLECIAGAKNCADASGCIR